VKRPAAGDNENGRRPGENGDGARVKAKKHGAGLQIRNAASKPFLHFCNDETFFSSAEETCAAGEQEEQSE
jgi:hypothetical protein